MTSPPAPVLYSFRRCPYAMRARLALTIAGIRCELREVRLRAKPAAMLAASPKGTVPVLVLADGTVLDESLDIMRWALNHRDPEAWLTRDDAALIAMNDGAFKHDLDGYKYPQRHHSDPAAYRDRGLLFLQTLDATQRSCRSSASSRPWIGSGSKARLCRRFEAGWPLTWIPAFFARSCRRSPHGRRMTFRSFSRFLTTLPR
jgi:glutathione S-transferase